MVAAGSAGHDAKRHTVWVRERIHTASRRFVAASRDSQAFTFRYGGLFGLIILFLDIYAIIRVAQSRATPGMKAVWIVLILFLPILGLILWALFGPKG